MTLQIFLYNIWQKWPQSLLRRKWTSAWWTNQIVTCSYFILLEGLVSKTNFTNQREINKCNLFHALNYLHTQIDLHGFNNCYNLCHLPISQCYYQVRTKWLPQVTTNCFVNEPYPHSWCFTKPNKSLLTSSSRLFTHPIIPRLFQDQEIMSLRPYVLS